MNNFRTQNIIPVTGGGTINVDVTSPVEKIHIKPAAGITLSSALNISPTGTPLQNTYLTFIYAGTITSDTATAKTVTIFGAALSDEQALAEGEFTAFYNGTGWKVHISTDQESGNQAIGGDLIVDDTIPTAALEDNAVTLAKLNSMARGSVIVGDASTNPSLLDGSGDAKILMGDGNDLNSVTISGDATITNTGVLTIGDSKITEPMLSSTLLYDSGWKTINNYTGAKGFGLPAFTTGTHPKVRVVGRQVFIEGVIIFPLDDGIGGLITDTSTYQTTSKAKVVLHAGTDDGYTAGTGGSDGVITSNQAMLPTDLRPSQTHDIRDTSLIFRSIADTAGTKSLSLTSILLIQRINTDGTLLFSTHANLDDSAGGGGSQIENTHLHTIISKHTSGDFAIDYSTYNDSFTGAADNRASAASIYTYPATFDGEDAAMLGGFPVNITTSYLIDETTTIADIKTAFDSI